MRTTFSILCLVLFLSLTTPAQAQLREDAIRPGQVSTRVYDQSSFKTFFNKLFSPEHFRMSHSYEMSMTSFGDQSFSMGMYTNTMQWQFNDKWAARMDVSVMQPFSGFGEQRPRVFLRNAEVAYRPSENMMFHFQIRQSPYGSYMRPYGYGYRPYGYHGFSPFYSRGIRLDTSPHDLFWKE